MKTKDKREIGYLAVIVVWLIFFQIVCIRIAFVGVEPSMFRGITYFLGIIILVLFSLSFGVFIGKNYKE